MNDVEQHPVSTETDLIGGLNSLIEQSEAELDRLKETKRAVQGRKRPGRRRPRMDRVSRAIIEELDHAKA